MSCSFLQHGMLFASPEMKGLTGARTESHAPWLADWDPTPELSFRPLAWVFHSSGDAAKNKGHLASLWSLVVSIGCCFACYQPWGPDTWSWHQAWSAWYTHAGLPFLSSENPFGALSFLTWAGPQWKNWFLSFFGHAVQFLTTSLSPRLWQAVQSSLSASSATWTSCQRRCWPKTLC